MKKSYESTGEYVRDTDMEPEEDVLVEEKDYKEWIEEVKELIETRYGVTLDEYFSGEYQDMARTAYEEKKTPEEFVKQFGEELDLIPLS